MAMNSSRREKEKKALRYVDAADAAEKHQKTTYEPYFTVPEGTQLFKFAKAKTYRLIVVPYKVGKGNPIADEGMLYFERTVYVHGGMGSRGQDKKICNNAVFHKRCAVCDEMNKIRRAGKLTKELWKELSEKERQLFLVIDMDEEDKGPQLFETAHYKSFGEMLKDELEGLPPGDPRRKFYRLDSKGMIVEVKCKEDTFQGRKFYKPIKINIVPREKELDVSILDEVPCLDDLIEEMDYKKMLELFNQEPEPEGDDDDENEDVSSKEEEESEEPEESSKPRQRNKPSRKTEEVEEDEDDSEEGEDDEVEEEEEPTAKSLGIKVGTFVKHKKYKKCKVVHVSGDGTSLRIEDADGEIRRAIAPNECTVLEDEEEEEPAPKKKPIGKKKKPAKPEPDEEESEEEEEEEKEEPKPRRGKKKPKDEEDEEEEEDEIPFDDED